MAEKLTKPQWSHLSALAGGERSAYPSLHLGVLNSLSLKGLVKSRNDVGAIAMPANAIKWRLSAAGRAALATKETQ